MVGMEGGSILVINVKDDGLTVLKVKKIRQENYWTREWYDVKWRRGGAARVWVMGSSWHAMCNEQEA